MVYLKFYWVYWKRYVKPRHFATVLLTWAAKPKAADQETSVIRPCLVRPGCKMARKSAVFQYVTDYFQRVLHPDFKAFYPYKSKVWQMAEDILPELPGCIQQLLQQFREKIELNGKILENPPPTHTHTKSYVSFGTVDAKVENRFNHRLVFPCFIDCVTMETKLRSPARPCSRLLTLYYEIKETSAWRQKLLLFFLLCND